MKLITKILPQRKKYEKISKTQKIENIDWGKGGWRKLLATRTKLLANRTRTHFLVIIDYFCCAAIVHDC